MLHRQLIGALVVAMVAAGCATDSAEPNETDVELAATFDGLSSEANGRGDGDESAAFNGAAMAVRLGIRPTEVAVNVGGESRRYLAFVHVIRHGQTDGTRPALRTMVAYRAGDRSRPVEVLYMATAGDSVVVELPTGPRASAESFAVASWKDLANRQFWVATSGKAGIKLQSTGEPCPKLNPRGNVTCTVGEFGVLLDGVFHPLINNQRGNVDRSRRMDIGTRAGDVNGAVLVFN
ncbi:MAG: hypothetical protein ACKVZ0_23980 [Gemmatimonadales bacterium]